MYIWSVFVEHFELIHIFNYSIFLHIATFFSCQDDFHGVMLPRSLWKCLQTQTLTGKADSTVWWQVEMDARDRHRHKMWSIWPLASKWLAYVFACMNVFIHMLKYVFVWDMAYAWRLTLLSITIIYIVIFHILK